MTHPPRAPGAHDFLAVAVDPREKLPSAGDVDGEPIVTALAARVSDDARRLRYGIVGA